MDNQQEGTIKIAQLSLKYNPNHLHWKEHFIQKQQQQSNQNPLKQLNSTLQIAQQLLKQLKEDKSYQYPERKNSVSQLSPRYYIRNVKQSMYQTNKLAQSTCNESKIRFPSKPKTAGSTGRRHTKMPKKIPLISAQSWLIFDVKTGEQICGMNQFDNRQIASLTKIMTCWVSLSLCEELKISLDTKFTVPIQAEYIGGTTAQLQTGDILSIRDLLYGLMLPSGNDAAITLAHNFQQKYHINFLNEMNEWASKFDMNQTTYANVHGLMNEQSNSTAYDVALLANKVMNNYQFQKIVRCRMYNVIITDISGSIRDIQWENTNKLLYQGFKGVKTGNTPKAGPCVVEYYEDKDLEIIIVLLNSRTPEQRWVDAFRLVDYCR